MSGESERRAEAARAWVGPALWAAPALALSRAAVVFAMDHLVRGHDPSMARWRVAERLPWVSAWALATAIACAWMLARSRRSRAASGLAWLASVALCLGVLSGWPFDDPYHIPAVDSARGASALGVLTIVALAVVAGLRRLVRAEDAERRFLARPGPVAVAVLLLVSLPLAAHCSDGRPGETMTVREVVRDLVIDTEAWAIETARTDAPPRAGSITPAIEFRLDVGEMPAIVMPPPCRLTIEIDSGEEPLLFRAAAGCDLSVPARFPDVGAAPRIGMSIRIDGAVVLEHHRQPWAGEERERAVWARLGGADGVTITGRRRVTFETTLEGPAGDGPLLVGFGGVSLVRSRERARERASAEHPNIVLVVMDTLRADRTSLHGPSRPTTPRLDTLAARGLAYTDAYATSSWTWPSTASILTGLEPEAHGVVSDTACYLSNELETLAEVLQRNGYSTAAFSGNPLIAPHRNFDQGFETFLVSPDRFLTSDQLMPDALRWLDAHAATRFLLYVHPVDPHEIHRARREDLARFAGPPPEGATEHMLNEYADRLLAGEGRTADGGWDPGLVVPAEHLTWMDAAYDAAVASGDHWLGQLLDRIESLGLSANTLIVFTSDHGEEFLEHGHFKHGQSLHPELVHVPLVLAGPGVAAGRHVDLAVSNRHLGPTLARAGGAALASADAIDLLRPDAVRREPIFTSVETGWWRGRRDVGVRGLRADGWSAHYQRDPLRLDPQAALAEGRVLLFDLSRDAAEQIDVSASERERALGYVRLLDQHEERLEALRPRSVLAGRGTHELLRATGYAGDGR